MKDRVHKTAMSLSEGETYIGIHGVNISDLLASFAIIPGFTFGV